MTLKIFQTPEEQAQGLQYMYPIDSNTLYVFPLISEGNVFHSRNVRELFDLAFLSKDMVVLRKSTIRPEAGTDVAPPGTYMAVESKAGNLSRWGFEPGQRVSF